MKMHKKWIFYFSSIIRPRDYVIKGFSPNEGFRFSFVDNSIALKTAMSNFNVKDEQEASIMGKCFSTSLLISSFLKNEERIKVLVCFNNLNNLTSYDFYGESMANGEIRGSIYIIYHKLTKIYRRYCKTKENPKIHSHNSFLTITKTLYNYSEESVSSLELNYDPEKNWVIYDSMDLMNYYRTSDQIFTLADLFTDHIIDENSKDINSLSLGCLFQKMPGCSEEYLSNIFQAITHHKEWISIKNRKTKFNFDTIQEIFKNLNLFVEFQKYPIDYFCRCNIQTFKHLLAKIGRENLNEMKKNNQNYLTCFYCNKDHVLKKDDFDEVYKMIEAEEQRIDLKAKQ